MSKVLIQGDWLDGFSSGRKAALLDWQHRKEVDAFRVLCGRLKVKRWRKRYGRRAAMDAATRAKKRAADPTGLSAYDRKRYERRRALAAARLIFTCPSCGAMWCRIPGRDARAIYCSSRCRQRHARVRAR